MAKVSEVKFSSGNRFKGEFVAKRFNLFEDADLTEYSKLRTEANQAGSGITIEHIREYTRKTTTCEGEGKEQITTTTEEVFVVVQYWRKKPKRRGESDEDKKRTRRDWSAERTAS